MEEETQMESDWIAEVGIDERKRLYLRPATATFLYIHREACGVHWDPTRHHLHSQKPGVWPYLRWFEHLISAAASQSWKLHLTASTTWVNIPADLRNLMQNWVVSRTSKDGTEFPVETSLSPLETEESTLV